MSHSQTAEQLTKLVRDWNAAELRGDVATIDRFLADDFIGVGPLGFMLTKEQWLDRHRSGDLKYDKLDLSELQVRTFDRAAIVLCRIDQANSYRGNPITAQLRTTLVFVQQDGAWRLAGLQFSPIGQPPNFAAGRTG